MQVSMIVFQPSGRDFRELTADLRLEADPTWDVATVAAPNRLLALLQDRSRHHLVLAPADVAVGRSGRSSLIAKVRRIDHETPIVAVAEQGSVESAARAVAAGANDFLVLGENLRCRIATLLGKLRGLLEVIERNRSLDEDNAALRETLDAKLKIVGRSSQMRRLLEQIRRVAKVRRPVLIVGERGTGKELVARAIHWAADPGTRPMITVNCAAFNDALLESELFGHEKGAFTGADAPRRGKFEQADGGTLFLDEIGNMSLSFQEKILRVVEYGTYARVGGVCELHTTARIIAATNRDLREEIRKGDFLPDLYDRLTFETIHVPPLRERRGDIPVLAQYFLDQFAKETPAFAGKRLASSAIDALSRYAFPGNIRELKNIIERAACHDVENEITPEDLGLQECDAPTAFAGSFHEKLDAFAKRLILESLRQSGGNQARAARELGLPYHQFRYYVKKYETAERSRGRKSDRSRRG